jgi:branched-chain amino acid transport system substrate-binding protein
MQRPARLFTMLLLSLVFVLAACQQAEPTPTPAPAAQPSPTQPAAPAASPTPAAQPTPQAQVTKPTDPIGVLEIKPGEPIVLAWMLTVSGGTAQLGEDSKRGIEIAIDDLGGQLLGHKIELVGEDSGCNPEGGQAAATRLAANPRIVAIVGSSCSSEARVGAPIIDQAGLVMVSPSNTAPDLTDPAKHVNAYLRVAHNDKVQGRVAAEFVVNKLGLKKVATIHDGSLYAEQLANVFAENVKKLGGTVVAQEAVSPDDTDMRPVLTRIATQQPELIYYPIFNPAGSFITIQAKEISGLENVKLMSADGLLEPQTVQNAGQASVGLYLSGPDLTVLGPKYQEFVQKYQQKYGTKPVAGFHAHAYDATMMIVEAIKKVAVQAPDGTLYIPRKALRDALYQTKNFAGLTGNVTCDQYGDCADPKIAVYEVFSTDTGNWSDSAIRKIYP